MMDLLNLDRLCLTVLESQREVPSFVWPKLIEWVFWIFVVGTAVNGVLTIIGGTIAGNAFAAGVKGAQLGSIISAYMMPAGIFCTIAAIAGLMFVVQILVSLSRGSKAIS